MKSLSLFVPLLFVALATRRVTAVCGPAPYDLLIRNARIIDGSGNPWQLGDVTIRGSRGG